MPSSSSVKELSRLLNGLTLVLKEAAGQGGAGRGVSAFQSSGTGDLQALVKKALITATDLTGLTKGNLRQFSLPNHQHDSNESNKGSVVYFNNQQPTEEAADTTESLSFSVSTDESVGNAAIREIEDILPPLPSSSSSPSSPQVDDVVDVTAAAVSTPSVPALSSPVAVKRRKLRERKVPSTSFSRALG